MKAIPRGSQHSNVARPQAVTSGRTEVAEQQKQPQTTMRSRVDDGFVVWANREVVDGVSQVVFRNGVGCTVRILHGAPSRVTECANGTYYIAGFTKKEFVYLRSPTTSIVVSIELHVTMKPVIEFHKLQICDKLPPPVVPIRDLHLVQHRSLVGVVVNIAHSNRNDNGNEVTLVDESCATVRVMIAKSIQVHLHTAIAILNCSSDGSPQLMGSKIVTDLNSIDMPPRAFEVLMWWNVCG
jgi:hypothetical protein